MSEEMTKMIEKLEGIEAKVNALIAENERLRKDRDQIEHVTRWQYLPRFDKLQVALNDCVEALKTCNWIGGAMAVYDEEKVSAALAAAKRLQPFAMPESGENVITQRDQFKTALREIIETHDAWILSICSDQIDDPLSDAITKAKELTK